MRLATNPLTLLVLAITTAAAIPLCAQQVGGIVGTVVDSTGSAVPGAAVTVKNVDTNFQVKVTTAITGSYQASNLPIGNYNVSFSKEGFKTENHTSILVFGDRTATVDGKLEPGAISSSIEVTATPLLNRVDTTIGYVLDAQAINDSPLGTGSFTQLAILSPGLSAQFLNGSGSNAGLGNQAIYANGQRASSNSISLNGVTADNLFNGQTTSGVSSTRFTLSTGENFQSDNSVQTSGSVYDASGSQEHRISDLVRGHPKYHRQPAIPAIVAGGHVLARPQPAGQGGNEALAKLAANRLLAGCPGPDSFTAC